MAIFLHCSLILRAEVLSCFAAVSVWLPQSFQCLYDLSSVPAVVTEAAAVSIPGVVLVAAITPVATAASVLLCACAYGCAYVSACFSFL